MGNTYATNPAKGYPSPAEVKIYIGHEWVDDVFRIDYSVSNSKTPLYDYTSTFFKAVANGHTIVQGSLIINYRFPGYLQYAIRQKGLINDPSIIRGLNESAALFRDLAEGDANSKVKKLLLYKKLGVMENAKRAASVLYGEWPTKDRGDAIRTSGNAATHELLPPFNIDIRYGGDEALTTKTIEECHLIGESQTISAAATAGGDMSASGMPIFEVYTFFAKKVSDRIEQKANTLNKSTKY